MADQSHNGKAASVESEFTRHRDQLKRVVNLRLDDRLRGRIDASDVLQEAFLEATQRLPEYERDASVPFFIWLRFITTQKVAQLHRKHLGTQVRDVSREISLHQGATPEASTGLLSECLVGNFSSPSQHAMRKEMKKLLQDAVASLPPLDREVIALRHYEKLNNNEIAAVMGITVTAANSRYFRAIKKLKSALSNFVELRD